MSESFEGAMAYAQAVIADCDIPLLDLLQRAHKHEIEQSKKAEYARGYTDGQRSMDAEHRAVALRLQQLPLDEDSHGNLSQIARAVYHSDFGWTQGACRGLRDELIRLMGGVHDEPVSVGEPSDADCSDCHRCDGESGRVSYDELGNERHEAVCRLREIQTDAGGFVKALANALGVEWQAPRVVQTIAEVRDRLIHLLGGDEPNFTEIAETIKLGDEFEDKLMENGENHKIATITDELRECVHTATKQYDDTLWYEIGDDSEADHTICYITEGELLRVADSIDEWHKRLCEQQEAVLQETINEMVDERDELQVKLDAIREVLDGTD